MFHRISSTSSMPFMKELLADKKPAKKPVQDDKLSSSTTPFMNELFADNKPGKKTDFDLD